MPLSDDIKTKWLEALRSGKYEQTTSYLRRRLPTEEEAYAFCCLGVLCDVSGAGKWDPFTDTYRIGNDEDDVGETHLPAKLRRDLGIDGSAESTLVNMNDGGSSFLAIADYIERKL